MYTSTWPGECGRLCRNKVVLFWCFNYGWMRHLVCLASDVEEIKTIVKGHQTGAAVSLRSRTINPLEQ